MWGRIAGIMPGTDWNGAKKMADATLSRLRRHPRDLIEMGSAFDPIVMKAIDLMLAADPLVQVLPWEPPRVDDNGQVVNVEPTMTVGFNFGVGNVLGRATFEEMRETAKAMTGADRHMVKRMLEGGTTREAVAAVERAAQEGQAARGLIKL